MIRDRLQAGHARLVALDGSPHVLMAEMCLPTADPNALVMLGAAGAEYPVVHVDESALDFLVPLVLVRFAPGALLLKLAGELAELGGLVVAGLGGVDVMFVAVSASDSTSDIRGEFEAAELVVFEVHLQAVYPVLLHLVPKDSFGRAD